MNELENIKKDELTENEAGAPEKAKDKKMKGRNMVAQPKTIIIISLNLYKIRPRREKEIIIKKATAKKKTWAIEDIV